MNTGICRGGGLRRRRRRGRQLSDCSLATRQLLLYGSVAGDGRWQRDCMANELFHSRRKRKKTEKKTASAVQLQPDRLLLYGDVLSHFLSLSNNVAFWNILGETIDRGDTFAAVSQSVSSPMLC